MPTVTDLFSLNTPQNTPTSLPTQGPPTPSISPEDANGSGTPQATSTPVPEATQPTPTLTVAASGTPAPSPTGELPAGQAGVDLLADTSKYPRSYIFRDFLSPGWRAWDSWNVYYYLGERNFVHGGRYAIKVTPVEDYGGLFFHLGGEGAEPVLREDVAGVSFWINPGDQPLHPDDLAVAVIGSNEYPYWVREDNSVEVDYETKYFSETRLSLLDFNNELQPDTWYQVVVWLDDLPYDPDYQYLTGFYIKNDAGVKRTYYVDDVILVNYAK